MSIKNVLVGTTFEYEVDRGLEESGDPWSREQNVEDEVGFVRECDAVRAISLSAHSEDVDERGMIKVTKWDGEDLDSICFAKRNLEWGTYFMDHDINGRLLCQPGSDAFGPSLRDPHYPPLDIVIHKVCAPFEVSFRKTDAI